jgi:simple sugar transport system permease protein
MMRLAPAARRLVAGVGTPLGSVIIALIIGALIVLATRGSPLQAYQALLCGGVGLGCYGGENAALQISNTIVFATPLILTGLSVAYSFRGGLFNIGAEGQMLVGAIATTVLGIKLANWPELVLLPTVLIAGTLAGAVWGGIVGVLKATTGAHEVVTTIMLNYVALLLEKYLIVGGPLQLPHGYSASPPIATGAELPPLLPQGTNQMFFGLPSSVYQANTGIVVAVLVAVLFGFILRRTSPGYELRAVGQSPRAARFAGISIRRTTITLMLVSGAFAGLAGAVKIAGVNHNLTDIYTSDTTGFDAIAVALLGQMTAIGVVLSALLFGALHAGGAVMQSDANISGNLVYVLEALILFSLAANFLSNIKLPFPSLGRRRAPTPGEASLEPEPSEVSVALAEDPKNTA